MLIRRDVLERIEAGEIDLAFRRWRRPSVRAGGTLTTAIGVLAIDAVDVVDEERVTADEAARAGFDSVDALRRALAERTDGSVHRVRFHRAGADPRIALREDADLDATQVEQIAARLDRLDRARDEPWTRAVLEMIRARPATRAPDLATAFGRDTKAFKTDVRKLKALGLTESLVVGYRLSPRGEAFLDARPATGA
ncbi:MAG: hypothetical protein ACRDZZ_13050 [Ilumatobacteraceae bacterium]